MNSQKKIGAAIAAVITAIKTEEEMLCMQASMGAPQAGPSGPSAAAPVWSLSGRQAQAQMRNLMQLKAFHGGRLR